VTGQRYCQPNPLPVHERPAANVERVGVEDRVSSVHPVTDRSVG
jgi:hypothetical protein